MTLNHFLRKSSSVAKLLLCYHVFEWTIYEEFWIYDSILIFQFHISIVDYVDGMLFMTLTPALTDCLAVLHANVPLVKDKIQGTAVTWCWGCVSM